MIITVLKGGLGNQMFQYAAGKSLAARLLVPLFVDTSFLRGEANELYTKRHLELEQLNVKIKIPTAFELDAFQKKDFLRKLLGFKRQQPTILIEGETLIKEFFTAKTPVLLDGFWQSEYYFKDIRESLLAEFTPNFNLNLIAKNYLDKIEKTESIAVHVRRGDYVSNISANNFHGVLVIDYYLAAFQLIQKSVKEPHFFVFSDDLDWCRLNFPQQSNFTFVDLKTEYSSVDLLIMKECKHVIIANSSYSWWAAWLNTHPNKIVIAPKNWFRVKRANAEHIYCKDWIKL